MGTSFGSMPIRFDLWLSAALCSIQGVRMLGSGVKGVSRCLLAAQGRHRGVGAARAGRRRLSSKVEANTQTPPPEPRMKGFFGKSLKEHYYRNQEAVNNIALSFAFFYCTGQIYVMKNKRDIMEAELVEARRELEGLTDDLQSAGWSKEAAARLGVPVERFSKEIAALLDRRAGRVSPEDMQADESEEEWDTEEEDDEPLVSQSNPAALALPTGPAPLEGTAPEGAGQEAPAKRRWKLW